MMDMNNEEVFKVSTRTPWKKGKSQKWQYWIYDCGRNKERSWKETTLQ